MQLGAADPALHSPPASRPHQGRFTSLRDGLRPPLTPPLRQAPLLRHRVGGSLWPVQHSAEADGRPQELRAAQEPERAYCAAIPAAMTGVNVAAVPGRGRWPGLRSDPRLGRCAADGALLAMGDRGRPRHCLPRIRARRERLHRRWRLVGRTTTPTLRTRASRDTDDFSRYPRGTSRVRKSQNHPSNHPPQSHCAAKTFAARERPLTRSTSGALSPLATGPEAADHLSRGGNWALTDGPGSVGRDTPRDPSSGREKALNGGPLRPETAWHLGGTPDRK